MSQESQAKRLNKYISETGFCSRREADKLIEQGRVTINDSVPEMGTKVMPDEKAHGRQVETAPGSETTYQAIDVPQSSDGVQGVINA